MLLQTMFIFTGTEEEHDRIRKIVSQGPDFDKYEKYKKPNTFNELIGFRPDPKKGVLGSYVEHAGVSVMNDRCLSVLLCVGVHVLCSCICICVCWCFVYVCEI